VSGEFLPIYASAGDLRRLQARNDGAARGSYFHKETRNVVAGSVVMTSEGRPGPRSGSDRRPSGCVIWCGLGGPHQIIRKIPHGDFRSQLGSNPQYFPQSKTNSVTPWQAALSLAQKEGRSLAQADRRPSECLILVRPRGTAPRSSTFAQIPDDTSCPRLHCALGPSVLSTQRIQ
jgi:hypothetical protein